MLSPCPPFHEDNLNERADITYASSCIHYKRSVQTSRVYGGCTTCWELVTWQSMILSFGNPNGPCWSWLTLSSIGIVYSHSPLVLLCTYTLVNIIWWIVIHTVWSGYFLEMNMFTKKSDLMRWVTTSNIRVVVTMLTGWSLTIVDSNSCVFESLMFWKLVADSLLE